MTTHSPTLIAEKATAILGFIRRDIAEGLYEDDEQVVLDGFMRLHDFVDANDYVLEVLGWLPFEDPEWEFVNAITDAVDTLLFEQPITV
jgi:hypothetical protein